jgi:DNA-binding transcriptional ArsR family regulator
MNALENDIKSITEEFENCQKLLIALGDESRQCIIIEMMKMDDCNGARVGEITERTHLSRPAVSHHLQILKDAGVVKRRKEGTKNYYYFDEDTKAMDRLLSMIAHAKSIMVQLPDRRRKASKR